MRDDIYAQALTEVTDFRFDDKVAAVFPDMIGRSVPGYQEWLDDIAALVGSSMPDHGRAYDPGSALGATTGILAQACRDTNCEIIGIDNSPAMIAAARAHWPANIGKAALSYELGDLRSCELQPCDVITCTYTLQFVRPRNRARVLRHFHQALAERSGYLVLSEKIIDSDNEQLMIDLHHDFKRRNGYSDLEIAQKRQAIENVLIPDSLNTTLRRLKRCGFSKVSMWQRRLNFISVIAWA